ncbi:MAG: hypothetical protein HY866_07680 [Chloroflexi bacterium]|nr:hypothetical protein [Chloroflexota bacterium]
MSDIIIIDNEYISMSYLPDKKFVYHTTYKPVSGQILRDALLAGLETLQKYGAHKWLSDERKNGPMTREDQEWGRVNLNPRAVEIGWKYWALVVPEQLIAAGSMAPAIEEYYELGMRMMVFSDVKEAIQWLDRFED